MPGIFPGKNPAEFSLFYTEKNQFMNLVKINQIWIVITLIQLIWHPIETSNTILKIWLNSERFMNLFISAILRPAFCEFF